MSNLWGINGVNVTFTCVNTIYQIVSLHGLIFLIFISSDYLSLQWSRPKSRSNQWLGPLCQSHLLHTDGGETILDIIVIFFFFCHLHLTMINLLIGIVEEAIHVLMITRRQTERPSIFNYCINRRLCSAAEQRRQKPSCPVRGSCFPATQMWSHTGKKKVYRAFCVLLVGREKCLLPNWLVNSC